MMKFSFGRALALVSVSAALVISTSAQTSSTTEISHAARISAPATTAATNSLPRWVKFSGTLTDASGAPRTGTVGVVFAIYTQATGGSSLWLETQNVVLDANGKYSALLGAGSPDGMPA